MIAVITGDLVRSNKIPTKIWTNALKEVLSRYGSSPKAWVIYRGDEFQLEIKEAKDALEAAILIKAFIKSLGNIDVRLSIGVGKKEHNSSKITESNGSAFVNSGRSFEEIKKSRSTILFTSGNEIHDKDMNFVIQLATEGFMDKWTVASAQIVKFMLLNPSINQLEVASKIELAQSAVSKRLSRAQFDLTLDLIAFYQRTLISEDE
jgi:hypothetical protein